MVVTGIGGLFFRAQDPAALGAWYGEHLHIGPGHAAPGAGAPDAHLWITQGGPVVFAPFAADNDYFAPDKPFMLNLRVTDLAAMITALNGAGIPVEQRAEWDDAGMGHFARLHDPEGNPIELWESAD